MRQLRILDAAAREAVEAAAWYEEQRPGLGYDFQRAIDAALDLLEDEAVPLVPAAGAAGRSGLKRLILRRFRHHPSRNRRSTYRHCIRAPLQASGILAATHKLTYDVRRVAGLMYIRFIATQEEYDRIDASRI